MSVTPGPWRVSQFKQGVSVCGRGVDCYEIEAKADACWIAQVQNHRSCIQTPEGNANARLISLAPEMLEILKDFVHWSEELGSYAQSQWAADNNLSQECHWLNVTRNEAIEVIARLEGRTK